MANSVYAALPTTIFSVMSGLAREHEAINLGQGFPDEPGPEADHIRLLAEYGLGEAAHPDGALPGIVPSDSTDAEERM